MANMASWGPMIFTVSANKVIALQDFTTSMNLKEDSENDTSGTPPTNTRGRDLIPMTFSETCVAAAGVNPLQRYSMWGSLLGQTYPLIIGGQQIGPARMKLKNVSMTDVVLSAKGDFLKASIAITLEEWSAENTSALLEEGSEEGTEEGHGGVTGPSGVTGTGGLTPADKKAALNATRADAHRKEMWDYRQRSSYEQYFNQDRPLLNPYAGSAAANPEWALSVHAKAKK